MELARCLASDANLFLFDEPFAGLSPKMVHTIATIIKQLKKQGKTIILVEHNLHIIRKLSDYVYVLNNGKLLAYGKQNEVLKKKEVIQAYLG